MLARESIYFLLRSYYQSVSVRYRNAQPEFYLDSASRVKFHPPVVRMAIKGHLSAPVLRLILLFIRVSLGKYILHFA